MGRGVNIPWAWGQNAKDKGVKIPWVGGGQYAMNKAHKLYILIN
jgi:hypothetical protein